jgi:predicted acyltransferase
MTHATVAFEKKTPPTSTNTPSNRAAPSNRLLSLDALRGFDMLWIIGGAALVTALAHVRPTWFSLAVAAQFDHVPWAGLHLFDVIWPLFMFMVGVSLSLSLTKRRQRGESHATIYAHAIRRALILFVLGMIAQGNLLEFDLATLHPFYSVLGGIAAGYLIATIVTLYSRPTGRAIVTAIFLVLYWILLITIPVPGVGRGVLTSTGNAATYIDRIIMGRFYYAPANQANTWFLSYLGFAASVLLGVLAGDVLQSSRLSMKKKCLTLYALSFALIGLGIIWSLWLPVIKLLWTSSFVLLTGGISCFLLATFYLVIDVLGYRRWTLPFTVIGMNALAIYMATNLFDFRLLGNIFVGHLLPRIGTWDAVLSEAAALTIIWLILYWMYRTRSFVKI